MKKILAAFAVYSLFAISGCQVSSPQGGGLASADGFKLVVTPATMTLWQGATETINVAVSRGDNFKQDVRIQLQGSDKGVTIDPANVTVKATEQPSALIKLSADKNTPVGDYKITITGTPTNGAQTITDIMVKVLPQ